MSDIIKIKTVYLNKLKNVSDLKEINQIKSELFGKSGKISDEFNEISYDWSTGELIKNNTFYSKNIIPYQSSRTLNILEDLLIGKSPKVSTLHNAIRIHHLLIDILQPSWNEYYEINDDLNYASKR